MGARPTGSTLSPQRSVATESHGDSCSEANVLSREIVLRVPHDVLWEAGNGDGDGHSRYQTSHSALILASTALPFA